MTSVRGGEKSGPLTDYLEQKIVDGLKWLENNPDAVV
jgi:hypothetical protein